ncbi:hypothetical protein C1645_821680 [Glomus cerebriforme]|uniref:F-box domain-containing protein n=1 Tax=Glomus cerebriforme TaxID=658196 RepID=A0A397T0F4_9GLOM|nr:hypothetical protein C1645_821680 [Glomus cerebriforme]
MADSDFICDNHFIYVFELILKNPNLIYNIRHLNFGHGKITFDKMTKNCHSFLKFLCISCNSISSLYFYLSTYVDNALNDKYLPQLINSQHNLKKILFGYSNFTLYNSLLSLKNSNCSNTLVTIIFYYIDFESIDILKEVFEQLNALESIHLICCYSLNANFIRQIVNINKPFKLKSLILINEKLNIESLQLLFQKSSDYLENFGSLYRLNESELLLESIMKYCNKIKILEVNARLNNQDIYQVFNLINNIQQNLNYLSINVISVINYRNQQTDYFELSSIILLNLGQILPFKLEYLNLRLVINPNDLEVFLKNSQNTIIKKLVITNIQYQTWDILPYIKYVKKYIFKKKRVEYLAIKEVSWPSRVGKELFSLKDEMKEFKLHNIQVLRFDDLYIDFCDFIKEID